MSRFTYCTLTIGHPCTSAENATASCRVAGALRRRRQEGSGDNADTQGRGATLGRSQRAHQGARASRATTRNPASLSCLGHTTALRLAIDRTSIDLGRARDADREAFALALHQHAGGSAAEAEAVEYVTHELTDLDEIADADANPDINYLYGRLAAFEWLDS